MIVDVDYIDNGETIIISPQYNKPLDSKLLSQSNYKTIFFPEYKLSNKLFDIWENDNCNDLMFASSDYNQPFGNSLNNCQSLTHIVFGVHSMFNCPLANSLVFCTALTHIFFGIKFNQPLGNSLFFCTALTHIEFGFEFNCILDNSLDNCTSLIHLGLEYCFNQKINLPHNIRSLSLNFNNVSYIDNLPNSIEELELGSLFNMKLDNLPSSIKKITFSTYSTYDEKLNCLPNGLLILQLPLSYNHQILNIPRTLTKLICSSDYPFTNDFYTACVETY